MEKSNKRLSNKKFKNKILKFYKQLIKKEIEEICYLNFSQDGYYFYH